VCRLYAVLPCVITALVAGVLCAVGHGVALAASLVIVSFVITTARFPDFREGMGAMAANALLYFAIPRWSPPWARPETRARA
jgi:hypothetical protein